MVAQSHEGTGRHNALLDAGIKIAELERDLQAMTVARNANRIRAERAESVVHQLEAQITHPAKETTTLVQQPQNPEDWRKADTDLIERINAGWAVESEIVNTVEVTGKVQHFRIVRFSRTAPIEPATDQPPITEQVQPSEPAANPVLQVYPVDPVKFPPAHSSIIGLWNALYQMDRYAELVQHWPKLPEYAPRVYAVFEAAGCDMTDVVIMKSFRMGHRADESTLKAIFPKSTQIIPGTRTALVAAGFGNVVQRDGREFIFDLPTAWLPAPRKTITASSMTIMTEGNAPGMTEGNLVGADLDTQEVRRAQLHDVAQDAYNDAMARNPLPPYRKFPFTSPSSV